MPQRPVVLLAFAATGLLLAACATGSAPSFADSGLTAASPASPALPPGPILAASGNAVLPIYDLGGGLVTPSIPGLTGTGLQAQLAPGAAAVGVQAGPLTASAALTAPLQGSPSLVLPVDLGGTVLVSPRPVVGGAGPALGLLGPGGPLSPVLGRLPIGGH